MANSSNNSFLDSDSGILDINLNLSKSENSLFSDTVPETVLLSGLNVDLAEDAMVCKPPISEPHNFIEIPENLHETLTKSDESTLNSNDNNNKTSDSGVIDSDNNLVDNTKLIDFTDVCQNLCNGSGVKISDFTGEENYFELKDEEFHDAVQFFKDPASLTFLENAGASTAPTEPLITRSSLYMNFDPLHAKFFSQLNKPNDLHEIVECDTEPPEVPPENSKPEVVNKLLSDVSPRESIGNILISFDSPLTGKSVNVESAEKGQQNEPQKLYTEDELQQALKIQELSVQETFLKRQQDLELERTKKQQEMEEKLKQQEKLCVTLHSVLKEIIEVTSDLSDKERMLTEKLVEAEVENNKLKEDLKTSCEDLQSIECTFSDFHKRYEQCKSMLKVYTQNEDNLKLQLEDLRVQLNEKDEMFKALQSRTQEMLDKANVEVSSAKKAGDAQVAVLKAQLKKAELKISSLESDVKHVKIENDKLSSICDDLMAKVSES